MNTVVNNIIAKRIHYSLKLGSFEFLFRVKKFRISETFGASKFYCGGKLNQPLFVLKEFGKFFHIQKNKWTEMSSLDVYNNILHIIYLCINIHVVFEIV